MGSSMMFAHTMMTTLKLLAVCPLVLAVATGTKAEQGSGPPAPSQGKG